MGVPFQNFLQFYFILMPGGRARGNPGQIFFEIYQKISPDRFEKYFQDLHTLGPYKEICY